MAASSSSSSASKLRHHLLNSYGGGPTSAPPPTPSTQTNHLSSDDAVDTLSLLLHRHLAPNLSLSLPTRRHLSPRATTSTTTATTTTPTSPLPTNTISPLSLSSLNLPYFQLAPSNSVIITPQLAESAESEALSLLNNSPHVHKKLTFSNNEWPLGFDDEDDETTSFCFDASACNIESVNELASLKELTRELEKLGLEVVEALACALGFENPFREKKEAEMGPSSLMWVSEDDKVGRVYPYVVGVQYQIRKMKWSLLTDSGSVVVEPEVGSVLVTLGDIAQVWSNGKLKKVRGRPAAISEEKSSDARCISMTLLLTLPLESTVSPLVKIPAKIVDNEGKTDEANSESRNDDEEKDKICDKQSIETSTISYDDNKNGEDQMVFNSFPFEDYAWRVYHERFPLKDPLDRYRITNDQVLN